MSETTIEEENEAAADYSSNPKIKEAAGLINKAVGMMPDKGYWTRSRSEIDETISYIQGRAKVLTAEFEVLEGQLKKAADDHYERTEKEVNAHCARMQKLKDRMKGSNAFNLPKLPWNLKEFLDFAERLDSMSPESLGSVIKLANALNQ